MHPKLKELEEAARAATKGPWNNDAISYQVQSLSGTICEMMASTSFERDNNASFIAAANPDTVLKLVEVIQLLRKDLVKYSSISMATRENIKLADDTLNRIGAL